jgi:F0F1-type ATP synthase delta subunit
VDLVLLPDGSVRDDAARSVLESLPRSQIKAFRAALRRELARRSVTAGVAGPELREVGDALAARYPGRVVDVRRDEGLGAGVSVRAGDDIYDASIRGYIHTIIEKLEAP